MIFVTGATGHTGCRMVRRLVEKGRAVRCLVRTKEREKFLPKEGVEVVPGDLLKPQSVAPHLAGVEALINAAHIKFAPQVIRLCRDAGVRRALFLSSTRRYTRFPCQSAEQVIMGEDAVEKSGLDYTIIRSTMIYGGPRDNNMTKLLSFVKAHRLLPLFGSGKNLIQPIFVWDLVDAAVSALERPESGGKSFTVAGPEALTYRRALEIIASLLGKKLRFIPVPLFLCLPAAALYEKIASRPRITAEQIRRFGEDKAFDPAGAVAALDFQPRSFQEGIRLKLEGKV